MLCFMGMKKQRRGKNHDNTEREDNVSLHHYIANLKYTDDSLPRLFPSPHLCSLSTPPIYDKSKVPLEKFHTDA